MGRDIGEGAEQAARSKSPPHSKDAAAASVAEANTGAVAAEQAARSKSPPHSNTAAGVSVAETNSGAVAAAQAARSKSPPQSNAAAAVSVAEANTGPVAAAEAPLAETIGNGTRASDDENQYTGGANGHIPVLDGSVPKQNLSQQEKARIQREYTFNGTHYKLGTNKLDDQLRSSLPSKKCVEVDGFGNCAWLAIAISAGLPVGNFKAVKQRVLQFMTQHRKDIQDNLRGFLTDTDDDWFLAAQENLKTDGCPITDILMKILAQTLHANIEILDIETLQPVIVHGHRSWMGQTRETALQTFSVGYRRDKVLPIYDSNFKLIGMAEGHYWGIQNVQGNGMQSATGRH